MHLQDNIPDFDEKRGRSVLIEILPLDAKQMNPAIFSRNLLNNFSKEDSQVLCYFERV